MEGGSEGLALTEYEYPTEEMLGKIEAWGKDFKALMEFVRSIWWEPDWGWSQEETKHEFLDQKVVKYCISTGGWSGNEDIIAALEKNFAFWIICWVSERRGGHFEFEVPITNANL